MAANASAPAEGGDLPDAMERVETLDQLIEVNWDLLEEAVRKAMNGKMQDVENEKARARWHREANNHLDQMRKLMNERELTLQAVEIEQVAEERRPQLRE